MDLGPCGFTWPGLPGQASPSRPVQWTPFLLHVVRLVLVPKGFPGLPWAPRKVREPRGPDTLELTWSGASTSVLGGWEGARLRGPHAWKGPQRRDENRGTAEDAGSWGSHLRADAKEPTG